MEDKKRSASNSSRKAKRSRRGNDSEDLGYESYIASSQSQSTSQHSSGVSLSSLAEVGIIERVSLTNFMCHSKLDFDFGPNITFIIGQNGSGKSAVLTALVIGLGGKASVTSRGTNVKNFIKNGQSYANIVVQLRNKGPDAFKPNEYGNSIIVERKILRDGISTYKIKSEKGKIMSTKKEELSLILDQFNIQVDNPVSVLTQNVSRNFLNSKNPKDKYNFFLKATQLDQIKKANADAAEKAKVAEDRLNRRKELMPEQKHQVDFWGNKYSAMQNRKQLTDKVSKLNVELAWSMVISKENESKAADEEYQTEQKKAEDFSMEVKKLSDLIEEESKKSSNLKTKLDDLVKKMGALRQEGDSMKKELQKVKDQIRSEEYERRKTKSEIGSAENEEATLKRQINDIRSSEPQDNTAERELRNKQISELEEQRKELQATRKSRRDHLELINGSISQHQEVIQGIKVEQNSVKMQLNKTKESVLNLAASRRNQYQKFGPSIQALVDNIDKAWKMGHFHTKPLGPVATLFTLQHRKWALAVENCLGGLLESFCCDNYDDEKVLKQLINSTVQKGDKPSIVVGKFMNTLYDVRKFKAVCNRHPTILDVLRVSDPVIANMLIDQRNIESILLIEDKTEARKIMTYEVPKNCSQCFTIEGDQIFPAPSFRSYANTKKFPKFLQGSADDEIKKLEDHKITLESTFEEYQKQIREKESVLSQNRQEARHTEAQIAKVSQDMAQLNSQLYSLTNFVEPEPVDVSSIEQEMKAAQEKQESLSQKLNVIKRSIAEYTDNQETLRKKYKENDENMQAFVNDTKPLRNEIDNLNDVISNSKNRKQILEGRFAEQKKKVEKLQKQSNHLQEEAESMSSKLQKHCPRPESCRLAAIIQSEKTEIEKNLKQGEGCRESIEQVKTKYFQAKDRFKRSQIEISQCEELLKIIKRGVESRQNKFWMIRNEVVIRIKHVFSVSLNTRQFRGTIKFDHKLGTLSFEIQSNQKVEEMCKDMRSLSGGERSFATVCFITSLWDTMESPFRILDEYDVFMDMVNRRISMDMMIDAAKTKATKQFIFLTPLEMTRINASAKICRMPDPERSLMDEEEDNL